MDFMKRIPIIHAKNVSLLVKNVLALKIIVKAVFLGFI